MLTNFFIKRPGWALGIVAAIVLAAAAVAGVAVFNAQAAEAARVLAVKEARQQRDRADANALVARVLNDELGKMRAAAEKAATVHEELQRLRYDVHRIINETNDETADLPVVPVLAVTLDGLRADFETEAGSPPGAGPTGAAGLGLDGLPGGGGLDTQGDGL